MEIELLFLCQGWTPDRSTKRSPCYKAMTPSIISSPYLLRDSGPFTRIEHRNWLFMPGLDQLQPKKARGTRCLEEKSIDPWRDRPRYFRFKIGVRTSLNISRKTCMLWRIISVTIFYTRLNKKFVFLLKKIYMRLNKKGMSQNLTFSKICDIMGQGTYGNIGLIPTRFGTIRIVYIYLV